MMVHEFLFEINIINIYRNAWIEVVIKVINKVERKFVERCNQGVFVRSFVFDVDFGRLRGEILKSPSFFELSLLF